MRRKDRELSDILIIEEIIKKADVCRIALATDNIPYIVTMNFGYTSIPERRLFFHSAHEGRKIDMIKQNSYVCFEMDTDHQLIEGTEACDWGMNFCSVVGYGYISILAEKEAKSEGLNCLMQHYSGRKNYSFDNKTLERTTILMLDILEMSGKRKIR